MAELTPDDLRHVAAIVRSEREAYELAMAAFATWLPTVVDLVMDDAAVVAAVDPDRASRAQEAWDRAIEPVVALMVALWLKRYRSGRKSEETIPGPAQARFRAGLKERLARVTKRTYETVQHTVVNGRRAGLSDAEIRATLEVDLAPENYEGSAARIARTSTMDAYNGGAEQGHRDFAATTGAQVTKTWRTILDGKARATHSAANGQTVPVGSPFQVGGYFCQNPGDSTLPAHESVNCRCVAIFQVSGVVAAIEGAEMAEEVAETVEVQMAPGWRGVLAPLDVMTGDGRILASPSGGYRNRQYPMSLTRQHVGEGQDVFVGTIDKAWVEDGMLMGEGSFDLGSEEGREASRQVSEGLLTTVSIDPDQVTGEQRLVDAEGNMAPDDVLEAALNTGEIPEGYRPVMVMTDWRLASAAIVSIPAYDEARIKPVFDYVRPVMVEEIVAAMGGQIFKREFFETKATGPTPLTVDEDGHIYGHVRLYGTCYQYGGGQGNGGYCVEPPMSACNYAKFHVHGAKMDDGSILPVGAITYGDGHESRGSLFASQEHYNDVATVAAKVVASEDEWGVWVTGEVLESHRDKAYDILLSPMSGHWEPDADNDGHLEMLAAHIVVTPGYAVRRIVASFDDERNATSLIVPSPWRKVTETGTLSPAKTLGLKDLRRAEQLAKKLGLDRESRAERIKKRFE
jgi:hypothetical protein